MEEAKPLQELEPQLVAGSFPVSYWVPLLDTQVFAFESFLAPRPGWICRLSSQRGNLDVLCLQHDAAPDDSCSISGPAARGVQLGQVRGTGLLCSTMHWHPLMTQLCISVRALVAAWLACLSHCAGALFTGFRGAAPQDGFPLLPCSAPGPPPQLSGLEQGL